MAPRLIHALLSALWLACGAATASGLQVAPVSLTIQSTQNADGLWLSNTSDNVLHAQVRVYHWTQEGGEDKLTASRGLVISPPMLQLAPSGQQLIRAIRLGVPPNGPNAAEDAYRVIIDELPVDSPGKKGLQFVLRYSVPIFLEPTGTSAGAPQLSWTLHREGEETILEVANSGRKHAQVANLSFVDAGGHRIEVAKGLLGYVLPGAQMHWAVKLPAEALATGGTWEAMINGTTAIQKIPLVALPH
jgi:fimbrial chaperone protein